MKNVLKLVAGVVGVLVALVLSCGRACSQDERTETAVAPVDSRSVVLAVTGLG